jgi:hypothetical protein
MCTLERVDSAGISAISLAQIERTDYKIVTMPLRLDSRQMVAGDGQERINETVNLPRNGDLAFFN